MGRPKQLLALGDRCLLQRVVDEVAASRLDEIVLVLGYRAAEIRERIRLPEGARPARVVVNGAYAEGQGSSLRLGLQATDPRAVAAAVLLGDQPGVTSGVIDRVAAAFLEAGVPAARPVYDRGGERVPGHPVMLTRGVWSAVSERRGDAGARGWLAAHPGSLLEVELPGAPPDDVDTWEDYRRVTDAPETAPEEKSR
jgi:CTP:molybdopterin cytidylyltransferase MocA